MRSAVLIESLVRVLKTRSPPGRSLDAASRWALRAKINIAVEAEFNSVTLVKKGLGSNYKQKVVMQRHKLRKDQTLTVSTPFSINHLRYWFFKNPSILY